MKRWLNKIGAEVAHGAETKVTGDVKGAVERLSPLVPILVVLGGFIFSVLEGNKSIKEQVVVPSINITVNLKGGNS